MQNSNFIDFKRERELGQIITDTFKFARYNYKSLFKVVFKIVGPVLVVALLAFMGYLYALNSSTANIGEIMASTSPYSILESQFNGMFVMSFIILLIISLLFYAVFYAAINYSIASYINNEGTIIFEEVAEKVRQNWSRFLGLSFLAGIIIGIGLFLCVIPGIYLYVPMVLVFPTMTFHNLGVGDSITYSFKLVKRNWWPSFLTLLIMGIIYYLVSSIFQAPAFIYSLVKNLVTSSSASAVNDWVYLGLMFIGGLARFVLYGFMIISGAFIYFNLNEKRNQTGAFETIDNLGNKTTD